LSVDIYFIYQAEDGIRDATVTGVQTCALPILDGQPRVEYVVNLASNAVLDRLVEPAIRTARRLSKKSGETEHVYGEFRYKTKKRSEERRVGKGGRYGGGGWSSREQWEDVTRSE